MVCLLVVLNTKFKLRRDLESVSATTVSLPLDRSQLSYTLNVHALDADADQEHNTYALKSRTRNPAVVHVMTETYREGTDDDVSVDCGARMGRSENARMRITRMHG